MNVDFLDTTIGRLILVAANGGLVYCNWDEPECERKLAKVLKFESVGKCLSEVLKLSDSTNEAFCHLSQENNDKKVISQAKKQLLEYFAGQRIFFTVKTLCNGTDFQKKVWSELSHLNYGEKATYKEIGERVGNAKGSRAIANACGANPFAIIVPCHRVTGSRGDIGGYTGGIRKKIALLELERAGTL